MPNQKVGRERSFQPSTIRMRRESANGAMTVARAATAKTTTCIVPCHEP